MASNYTGTYLGIEKGNQVLASDMTLALNQMEKVVNKKDTITNSSTEYPSSKAIYNMIMNLSLLDFFPKGMILMTDGNWINGTGGWYICNGQNGTPNLTDKFIRASTSAGIIGGSNTAKIKLEIKHLPPHSHNDPTPNGLAGPYELPRGSGDSHDYGAQSAPTGSTGGGETYTINTVPNYYTLIFIKKMS